MESNPAEIQVEPQHDPPIWLVTVDHFAEPAQVDAIAPSQRSVRVEVVPFQHLAGVMDGVHDAALAGC